MRHMKRFVACLLSLALAMSLCVPASAAEGDNVIWDQLEGSGSSDVTLEVVDDGFHECEHGNKHYQDNGDGTHDYICDDCGDVLVDDEPHEDLDNSGTCDKCGTDVTPPGCSHGGSHYEDNGDGTHDKVCDGCGEVLVDDEAHEDADGDGTCDKCGADVTPPGCSHGGSRYVDNEDGETHDKICEGCGEVLIDDENHTDGDDDGYCDLCGGGIGTGIDDPDVPGGDTPILIATVPLKLPIIMDLKGNITVADDAVIRNHVEDKAIAVTDIQVTAAEGWSLAAMADDFRLKPEDSKVLAIGFRGNGMKADGSFELTEGNWNIGASSDLALNMSAKLPVQTKVMEASSIATVQFTLDWAADAGAGTSDADTGANDQANINASNDRTVTLTVGAFEHCTVDKTVVATDRSGKITELPNVTADEGYEFRGWVDGDGNEIKVGDVLPEGTAGSIVITPLIEETVPAVSEIITDWSEEELILVGGSMPVNVSWSSNKSGTTLTSVSAADGSVVGIRETGEATPPGTKSYTLSGMSRGKTDVTATLSDGTATSFTVNVGEIASVGDIDPVLDPAVEGGLEAGDTIKTGDVTVTIPVVNPDGSVENVTVTPEIDAEVAEGENNIEITIDVGGRIITIIIKVTVGAKVPEYTVTFAAGNGGTVAAAPVTVTSGTYWGQITKPVPSPTSGYEFDGWYNSDGDKMASMYQILWSQTVTARFREVDRTVTMTVGTLSHCTVDKASVTTHRSGTVIELPVVTAEAGYEFVQWTYGSGDAIKVGDVLPEGTAKDITITPVVEKTTAVAMTVAESHYCEADRTRVLTDRNRRVTELPVVTPYNGYFFVKWVDINGNEVKIGQTIPEQMGSSIMITPILDIDDDDCDYYEEWTTNLSFADSFEEIGDTRIFDIQGYSLTVTGKVPALRVKSGGRLYLYGSRVESKNGDGVKVGRGGFLSVQDSRMVVIGKVYGLNIEAGATAELSAGRYEGTTAAIYAVDGNYSALLKSGYGYFDTSGNPIAPANVASAKVVVVKKA